MRQNLAAPTAHRRGADRIPVGAKALWLATVCILSVLEGRGKEMRILGLCSALCSGEDRHSIQVRSRAHMNDVVRGRMLVGFPPRNCKQPLTVFHAPRTITEPSAWYHTLPI